MEGGNGLLHTKSKFSTLGFFFFLENWKTLHLASSIIASPHLSDPDEAYISCFVHSFLAEIHAYTHFFSILHVLSHF